MKKTLILALVFRAACRSPARWRRPRPPRLHGCVGPDRHRPSAVTTARIANGTISGVDIRSSTITSDKILNGTVAMADLEAALRADIGSAIADITFARITASGGGVVGAQCPSGRVAVAASCECTGSAARAILASCSAAPSAGPAPRQAASTRRSVSTPAPRAARHVRAICMGAESVDGTPWENTTQGLSVDAASPEAQAAATRSSRDG